MHDEKRDKTNLLTQLHKERASHEEEKNARTAQLSSLTAQIGSLTTQLNEERAKYDTDKVDHEQAHAHEHIQTHIDLPNTQPVSHQPSS
jgi:septal ring factor EnvC (AmiA/AmiB activator)